MSGCSRFVRAPVIAGCVLIVASGLLPATSSTIWPFTGAAQAAPSAAAIAEYRRKLKEYLAARDAFDAEAGAYWDEVSVKRRGRNAKRRNRQQVTLDDYVLTQPPVYAGPKRPVRPGGADRQHRHADH